MLGVNWLSNFHTHNYNHNDIGENLIRTMKSKNPFKVDYSEVFKLMHESLKFLIKLTLKMFTSKVDSFYAEKNPYCFLS